MITCEICHGESDRYASDTSYNIAQEQIRDSPLEYVVLPAATHAQQSQAIGEGVHAATAGRKQSFSILPKDAHGNFRGWPHDSMATDERHLDVFQATAVLLDIAAEGDVTFSVDVTYDAASRYFEGTYLPRTSGRYQLNIFHEAKGNSMHIRGSPFALDVLPGDTFAQESTAFGSGLHNGVAGNVGIATIQAIDANRNMRIGGGDKWEVTVRSLLTNDYQYGTTFDHGNGTYSLQVVPVVAGPNDLSIMLNGTHIRGSPFRMNVVHNIVDGSSSFVINAEEASHMKAMTENVFTIQAVDTWGNKAIYSEGHPHTTLVTIESESIDTSATQISYIGGGKYEITVTPILAGEKQVEIMLNSKSIDGSPWSISVHPGDFSAETSVATGAGLKRAQAGMEASFSIQSKDAGGNNKVQDDAVFNVTLTLVNRAQVPVGMEMYSTNTTREVVLTGMQSFVKEGQYLIQYTCFEAGSYNLYINDHHGNRIIGSPFSVRVIPGQLSGAHSIITGDGIIQGSAGQMAPVRMFPRDAYRNFIFDSQEKIEIDLTLQLRHKSKADDDNLVRGHTIKQLVGANSDGSFHLDYLTEYAGKYSLDVTTFLQGGLEASYYSSPDFAAEHLVFTSIEPKVDMNFGSLPITCQTSESSVCSSISDMAGPYHIGVKWSGKLKVDIDGSYEIRVECNDGGHVSITIDGEQQPWKTCWPYAVTSVAVAAKQVDFVLQYKNYEGNDPFVTAAIPSSNLLYQETIGNTFFPEIYPGSAYAPLSNAIGESLHLAVSGVEQEFLIETRDIHANLLLNGGVRVESLGYNNNATIETRVDDNGNGTYAVHYNASASGKYDLSVEVDDLHIIDSPFELTVRPGRSDPEASILTMDNDGLGVTGTPLCSRLQTRDYHRNIRYQGGDKVIAYLSAVETPSEKYLCQVDDDDTGTYQIECPSQWEKGLYLLDVSIEIDAGITEPLKSGPFNVTVFAGPAVASTTSVFSSGTPITADSGVPSVQLVGDAGVWGSFVVSTKDIFGNFLITGGNHFVTRVVGNNEAEVQVIDQENGHYIVAYKVDEASAYKVEVGMVTGSGLVGNYYLDEKSYVEGAPTITRIDDLIDFDAWQVSVSHATWTGYVSFPHSGIFELELTGIEGICRLFVGAKLIVDSSYGSSIGTFMAKENVLYEVKVDYSMDVNRLLLKMYWASSKMPKQIVPSRHYFNTTEPIHGSPFHLIIL